MQYQVAVLTFTETILVCLKYFSKINAPISRNFHSKHDTDRNDALLTSIINTTSLGLNVPAGFVGYIWSYASLSSPHLCLPLM